MTDMQCAICLGDMLPTEAHKVSMCQPVPHRVHRDCWYAQTEEQQECCCVCRQHEIGPTALWFIGSIIGTDIDARSTFDELPTRARTLVRRFQTSRLTRMDLQTLAYEANVRREKIAARDNALTVALKNQRVASRHRTSAQRELDGAMDMRDEAHYTDDGPTSLVRPVTMQTIDSIRNKARNDLRLAERLEDTAQFFKRRYMELQYELLDGL